MIRSVLVTVPVVVAEFIGGPIFCVLCRYGLCRLEKRVHRWAKYRGRIPINASTLGDEVDAVGIAPSLLSTLNSHIIDFDSLMTNVGPLQRQWNLLRLLSARRRGMTVQEMAQEASVSVKTVRRDLQTLSLAGFPLDETTEAHGLKRWMVQEGHRQSQMNFTLTEAASLFLGRQFLEPLAGTMLWDGARSAFRKIRSTLGESTVAYLEKVAAEFHQTAVGTSDYSRKSEIIDQLMIGIEDRMVTLLYYQSARATEPVEYEVHPYGLVYHRGSLYLVAHSNDHDEIRHFKVDRMETAEPQTLKFEYPTDFDLQKHFADSFGVFHGLREPLRVRVQFSREVARYVEESQWHTSQKLTRQSDGGLLFEVRLNETEEIMRWILSFGGQARALDPPELVEAISKEIAELAAGYGVSDVSGRANGDRIR